MRPICLSLLLLGTTLAASAQDLSRLPNWAEAAAKASMTETAPADAEAWVLLDRTEIAYVGDGEIRLKHMRLLRILEERGTRYRAIAISGLGGKASRVKKLKGWNLRPDGDLVKLDLDKSVTVNDASDATFSTVTLTGASLDRVMKGSFVAYETLESLHPPIGPVAGVYLLETLPVRSWELEVANKEGWFNSLKAVEIKIDRRHLLPLVTQLEELDGGGMRAKNLPALPTDEGAIPHASEVLPRVQVRFLDPSFPVAAMWGSWDAYARHMSEIYAPACQPVGVADLKGKKGLDGLRALWSWIASGLTYKQVYLSPDRGWVPETAIEVARKRYGDCKDLTAFLLGEAKGMGFPGAPGLTRIVEGRLEAGEPPFPRFNHVIAALKLDTSLGLPAEVETPQGRFVLVDPTDPLTPFGYLSSGHDQGRVMLCLPEGAIWVDIPASAILAERLDIQMKGEMAGRELTGSLVIHESGGYWGLRNQGRKGGAKAVREMLLGQCLDLPASAEIEVTALSDPLALDTPFEVTLKLRHPEGFRIQGGEGTFTDLGLPRVPGAILRPGRTRLFPIVGSARGELSYRAELKFPMPVKPIALGRSGKSSFRSFNWTSLATSSGAGTVLKIDIDHRFIPARFGFEARERGLQAWKEDRSLMKNFRDDALVLQVGTH